ncbi:trypsin-like peptidase domain-containing protein [Plantactinospora siamensis]|uniref:Trypsin-like peptidase domain-containing protein n=1 Tax=Plantactinospora siamensis TaxID=555372 RepID=A0ABV6NYY7_9ACTN
MTEHENDPQRPPASADAESSHPTAELSRAERGESGSVPSQPAAPERPGDPATPAFGAAGAPTSGPGTPTSAPGAPASGQPYGGAAGLGDPPSGQGGLGGYPPAGYPASGHYPGQTAGPQAPLGGQYQSQPGGAYQPAPGGHPHAQWQQPTHQAQQSGWAGAPGYAGTGQGPAHQPYGAGDQQPAWAQGPAGPPARPSRVGRYVAAAAVALALMGGSGIAGGVIALAVDHGSTVTRTYTAAPVLNQGDLPRIAAKVQNSVVSITTESGEGSGVILSADGYILTNNHVVASANGNTVKIIFADGKNVTARIVGTDPKSDLAVVKASGVSNLTAATFGDSDAMQVGDTVLALGSPLGLEGSVTAGIISARDRTIQASDQNQQPQNPFQQQQPQQGGQSISGLLQTDAPINPGNSGGALVNTRGEVIGINSAIATSGQGSGNIGLGFAIPSNKAKSVAEALRSGQKVSHPSLGVSVAGAENGGALVNSVVQNSPADKAGLQQGDVITKFGDKAINDSNALVAAVQGGKVGDQVQLTYTRNGEQKTATVTLAESS